MNEVEFLPERIRRHRAHRRRLMRQGYFLLAFLAGMGLLSHLHHGRVSRAEAQLADLGTRRHAMSSRIETIAPLEEQLAELTIKKRIESELGSRTDCTAVLAELCRVMPANTSLKTLEFKTIKIRRARGRPDGPNALAGQRAVGGAPRKPRLTTDRRVQVVLVGVAPTNVDVANFIGQLAASCLFEDVRMGYAKVFTLPGRTGREFEVRFHLAR